MAIHKKTEKNFFFRFKSLDYSVQNGLLDQLNQFIKTFNLFLNLLNFLPEFMIFFLIWKTLLQTKIKFNSIFQSITVFVFQSEEQLKLKKTWCPYWLTRKRTTLVS